MISPNGIIQLTVRWLAAIVALTGCAPPTDDGFNEDRPQYTVSSQAVQAGGVELTFESCSLPQQCDLILQISNKSDRCVAFNETELPNGHVWLDTTFNLDRRITGYPEERVRQTFVVLQPGEDLRQAFDLHAIYDVSDLTRSSLTFRTGFIECTAFNGAPAESFELVSAPINFGRAP